MATPDGAYLKELHKLIRTIGRQTEGQARIDIDSDELEDKERTFLLLLTPSGGAYRGATCKFQVTVPETYPEHPPSVLCRNNIYHPNIDVDEMTVGSSVCVNLLDSDWQAGVGLDGCVMALLFLFYHPNPDDALSPVFDGDEMDEKEFEKNVRASLRGEEVEGMTFDKLLPDDYVDSTADDTDDADKAECKEKDSTTGEDNGVAVHTEGKVNTDTSGTRPTGCDSVTDDTAVCDNQLCKTNSVTDENVVNVNVNNQVNEVQKSVQISNDCDNANTHNSVNEDESNDTKDNINQSEAFFDSKIMLETTNNACNTAEQNFVDEKESQRIENKVKKLSELADRAINDDHAQNQTFSFEMGNEFCTVTDSLFQSQEDNFGSRQETLRENRSNGIAKGVVLHVRDYHTLVSKQPSTSHWLKVLHVFGRFYRWMKGCTRRQSVDIYTVSFNDLHER